MQVLNKYCPKDVKQSIMARTELSAQRILGKTKVLSKLGVKHLGVLITNITFTDKEGNPFVDFKDTEQEREVALVSLQAMSPQQLELAKSDFANGDYDSAVSWGLSYRVPVSDIDKYSKGDRVSVVLDQYESKEYGTQIGVDSISPMETTVETDFNPFAKATVTAPEVVKMDAGVN